MIITPKQVLMMYQILRDSLCITDGGGNPFGFSRATRADLYNQIVNQQSNDPVDMDKKQD